MTHIVNSVVSVLHTFTVVVLILIKWGIEYFLLHVQSLSWFSQSY